MIDDKALDVLFRAARSPRNWLGGPAGEETLKAAYDLARMGPTSANCSPARFVFVTSEDGKEKLKPCLAENNVEKVMTAPAIAIIGYDLAFYEHLPKLYPFADAKAWFEGNDELIEETAFRNGTLQGAYLIMACRALGLDCGPMSGFDNAAVDAAFFEGTTVRSNFICSIGEGDLAALAPRAPRFDFDEACSFA